MINKIKNLLNEFIYLSKKMTASHPFIVTVLMHEYFRCIYPHDPFISKKYSNDYEKNIFLCLKNNISILKLFKSSGSYFTNDKNINTYLSNYEKDKRYKTQKLFGKLWEERSKQNLLNSKKILIESLKEILLI